MNNHPLVTSLVGGMVLIAAMLLIDVLKQGERAVSPLTTIRGVPYPAQANSVVVTEALAHSDIALVEPVLAKELELTITFIPRDIQQLSVGIRRDSFWLSYEPTVFYRGGAPGSQPATATIAIPLTDKLQDTDRSVDLMFFTDTSPAEIVSGSSAVLDNPIADTTHWELVSIDVKARPAAPTTAALKDYVRSVMTRERPL